MSTRATVLVGGHPFDAHSFTAMWSALASVTATIVSWPDAHAVFEPGGLDATDVLVLYDMPGVGFRPDGPPQPVLPSATVRHGWERLLDQGVPVVALHHAIAGWPAWHRFADIVGGRFHYSPARLRDVDYPDSGYRHNVSQTLTVSTPDHPVCAGLPASFVLTDETYLCPIFADEVTPLLATDAPLDAAHHWSAAAAVAGRLDDRAGWHHPTGAPLAAWTHRVANSTVVYLQPGDGPSAFENPHYRTLLGNAVTWASNEPTGGGSTTSPIESNRPGSIIGNRIGISATGQQVPRHS